MALASVTTARQLPVRAITETARNASMFTLQRVAALMEVMRSAGYSDDPPDGGHVATVADLVGEMVRDVVQTLDELPEVHA